MEHDDTYARDADLDGLDSPDPAYISTALSSAPISSVVSSSSKRSHASRASTLVPDLLADSWVPESAASTSTPRKLATPTSTFAAPRPHMVTPKSPHTSVPVSSAPDSSPRTLSADEIRERVTKRREEVKALMPVIRAARNIDLCFLVDCTGSMEPWITQTKASINSIIDHVKEINGNSEIRVAFVRYTDFDVKVNPVTSIDFTTDVDKFKTFVGAIAADGGDDTAEDVMSGLKQVFTLSWRPGTTKVLVHIADAPCHGCHYHSGVYDEYSNTSTTSHNEHMDRVGHHMVYYHFGKINASTDRMIQVFEKHLKDKYPQHPGISQFDIDVNRISALADHVVDSVASSLVSSVQSLTAPSAPRSIREFTLTREPPMWHDNARFITSKYNVKRYLLPKNIGEVASPEITLRTKDVTETVMRYRDPFAQGTLRLAYYAQIVEHADKKYVVKISKSAADRDNSFKSYLMDMQTQTIAAFLAQEFMNKIKHTGVKDVWNLKYVVAKVISEVASSDGKAREGLRTHGALEVFVDPALKFVKFNNNAGVVIKCAHSEQAQAFSHFTWVHTERNHMVVDVQGWVDEAKKTILLTDPAIHSKNLLRFGRTNTGMAGVKMFFETHKCGALCEALRLTSVCE